MNLQRNLLFIAFLLVSLLLFTTWESDQNAKIVAKQNAAQLAQNPQVTSNNSQTASDVPNNQIAPTDSTGTLAIPQTGKEGETQNITVTTDVLELTINTIGGDITSTVLLKYPKELDSTNEYFQLLENSPQHTYIAQSGLIGPNGTDTSAGRPKLKAKQDKYTLADGQSELRVPLTFEKDGVIYTKTFILKPNSYDLDVEYTVENHTSMPISVKMYAQLKQSIVESGGNLAMPTYRGAAYSDDNTKYKKYPFEEMLKGKQKEYIQCQDVACNSKSETPIYSDRGWVGMLQHYFAVAWIPRSTNNLLYTSTNKELNEARIGVQLNPITVQAGERGTTKATLWVGPKLQSEMNNVEETLSLSVDYGFLWFIASPIHKFLIFIQQFVNNWGFSIILLTFFIRGAMYPLTKKQYTSMAKMKMLQPQLKALQERCGDDKQRQSKEMMELYKKEKVNPLGGCLPLFIQMPIFLALYWALMESVELRHAPFLFWIQDLSAKDPYFILPICMGISMFLIQKMSPTTVTDPMQQKIMTLMPVIFTSFFFLFPSGLVLYYLMSNIVTLIQQTMIYRSLEKKGLHTKVKK